MRDWWFQLTLLTRYKVLNGVVGQNCQFIKHRKCITNRVTKLEYKNFCIHKSSVKILLALSRVICNIFLEIIKRSGGKILLPVGKLRKLMNIVQILANSFVEKSNLKSMTILHSFKNFFTLEFQCFYSCGRLAQFVLHWSRFDQPHDWVLPPFCVSISMKLCWRHKNPFPFS